MSPDLCPSKALAAWLLFQAKMSDWVTDQFNSHDVDNQQLVKQYNN